MSNAQKLNILRKTLQAAAAARGGDISQTAVLGQTQDAWPDLNGAYLPAANARQQYQHQQQNFFNGWNNAALPIGIGAEALARLASKQQAQQQQDAMQDAMVRDMLRVAQAQLPWQQQAQQQAVTAQQWQAASALQRDYDVLRLARAGMPTGLDAQLLTPAGPSLPLPFPMSDPAGLYKDAGPSRALLASLLSAQQDPRAMAMASMMGGMMGGAMLPDQNYMALAGAAHQLHHGQGNHQRMGGHAGGHATGAGRARGSSSSIALNKEIMGSSSIEQLLAIVRAHGHVFDFFNISTAVSRVPKLLDASHMNPGAAHAGPHGDGTSAGGMEVCGSAGGAGTSAGGAAPRDAACHLSPATKELADRLCALVLQHLSEFDGRGLANTAWAFAKLRYVPDASLPAQLCRAAIDKIHQFAPQNVSNLAWALVYMHYQDAKLLGLIKQKACEQVYEMKPQELANVMWALASHEQLDGNTARVLGERAAGMAGVFKEQELSNIVWALGRAEQYDLNLLEPLLAAARAKLHHFMPQGVSNMVWALGQLGHRDEALLAAVARHCPPSLPQYDSQALANLATGLACLSYEGNGLMAGIANEAASRAGRMTGQHLVSVVAACANLGIRHERLLAAVQELVTTRPACLEPPALASLAWAVSRMPADDTTPLPAGLLEGLSAAVVSKMERFTGQSLVAVAMAFAEGGAATGGPAHTVLQAVAARLPAAVHSLSPPQCMAVSWALLQAGLQSPEATSCLLSRVAQCAAPSTASSGGTAAAGPTGSSESQAARVAQLCASLVSAAHVGRVPDASLHPMLLAAAQAALPDMDAGQLAGSCWALAALGVLDVPSLTAYENALEGLLTSAPGLVGPVEVNQVCEAHVLVATQVAQRVGLPLTSLPQQLLPQLPPALAQAAHAASSGGGVHTPAAPAPPAPDSDLAHDFEALTLQLLNMTRSGPSGARTASQSTDNDLLAGLWGAGSSGADMAALQAMFAATQEVTEASNKAALLGGAMPSAPQTVPAVSTTHAAGREGNMAVKKAQVAQGGTISPNTLARWVSMWSAGGLGNGVMPEAGNGSSSSNGAACPIITHGAPRDGSPSASGAARRASSPSGVGAKTPSPSRANAAVATDPLAGWGDVTLSLERSAGSHTSLLSVGAGSAAASGADVNSGVHAGLWGTGAPGSVVSCGMGRCDSLEEAGGVWLPRDLLGAQQEGMAAQPTA